MTESKSLDIPTLWHIPFSHYSEKVRWALDYKRVGHRRRVPGFDYLFRNWRATGQAKLPILWLGGKAIADSTRIIAALEKQHPEWPLYPHDPAELERTIQLEDELDETLGPSLRAALFGPMFRDDPELALRTAMTGMPGNYRLLRPLLSVFPAYYRFRHNISDANLKQDRATVARALDRIEQVRQGKPYLIGDAFTLGDLTAAALLSPVLQPPEIQYPHGLQMPVYVQEFRASLTQHPAAQWAAGIYRQHRGHSSEVARTS